jgi:peptidoglycan hydrolase-like protein with peptidoglycan-binding domain
MRTTLIALAAAALALPALAQQQPNAAPQGSADQTQNSDQKSAGKGDRGQPMRLGRTQTRMLQTQLNRMGLEAGPADGVIGEKTRKALEKFQSQKGLNPSGQLDRETVSALRALRGQMASSRRSPQRGSSQPEPQSQPQPQNQTEQNAPK